jgi:membrane-bound lytic murein transglycosylase D
MTRRQAIALFAAAPFAALAGTNDALSVDGLLDLGQQFLEENVDDDVLAQLGELDQEKVRALLRRLEVELEQQDVLDLAAWQDTAETALKLFDASEVTEPYAGWLRARLDYFAASQRLKQQAPPPPKLPPGRPAAHPPAPTVRQVRITWDEMVRSRPRPPAAAKYEFALKPVFAANGVPQEFFWLAEIESGFNPKARSPSGAVGMYQLMPNTAKALGLSTWPFDERKNPEKCAGAAARHLRALYKQFSDWPLTVAAYNAGLSRVKAKLDGRKRKTFADIAASLPSQTQLYVPKLSAVLRLREGVALEKLPTVT